MANLENYNKTIYKKKKSKKVKKSRWRSEKFQPIIHNASLVIALHAFFYKQHFYKQQKAQNRQKFSNI